MHEDGWCVLYQTNEDQFHRDLLTGEEQVSITTSRVEPSEASSRRQFFAVRGGWPLAFEDSHAGQHSIPRFEFKSHACCQHLQNSSSWREYNFSRQRFGGHASVKQLVFENLRVTVHVKRAFDFGDI